MGRSPCCDKLGLKKGPWTPEEDQKLLAFIEENGHGNWRALPTKADLQRCGKSCRLRWTNYLRPDIKRGKFSLQEEQTIIQLHALLGNRWSAIATHLPKRTDNEIKNYWNTHLKKRLTKMGIDPVTHKPKNDALVPVADGGPQQSKNVANLSHIAQWESARLEAEARLARQSKLRSNGTAFLSSGAQLVDVQGQVLGPNLSTPSQLINSTQPRCLDVFKPWQTSWPSNTTNLGVGIGDNNAIETVSPTSTLSFMGNAGVIEFLSHNNNNSSDYDLDRDQVLVKEKSEQLEWNSLAFNDKVTDEDEDEDEDTNNDNDNEGNDQDNCGFIEGFTELLLSTTTTTTTTNMIRSSDSSQTRSEENDGAYNNSGSSRATTTTTTSVSGSDYYEDNKNYWNSILHLVNSSPPHSPMF